MITIFNGRRDPDDFFVQVSTRLREHLYLFSGEEFRVFSFIALHIDKDGWARPSRDYIADKLGISRNRVSSLISRIEKIQINGDPVLHVERSRNEHGHYTGNRYQVFPDPCTDNPGTDAPCPRKTTGRRVPPKENHSEQESSIDGYLAQHGAHPKTAQEFQAYDQGAIQAFAEAFIDRKGGTVERHLGLIITELRRLGPNGIALYQQLRQESVADAWRRQLASTGYAMGE